ncbi:glutathione S-transferase family protein [Halospeciosus flavus]|uniref:Glutathione S-transferase family protein n=1 Tax=Halospeciosus flavus TaxID=3032283 RepID=A0ABD5Z7A3_9EURY|nr:glutathione S-transferase family protein [Halospeciosus flavus]
MGRLVDGEWRTEAEQLEHDESGEFERTETTFRDWIRGSVREAGDVVEEGPEPEAGRYHLYVSYACPWAHRTLLVRALKGLQDAITVDVVDPVRFDQGWEFAPEKPGCTEESQFGHDYLRDVYTEADPNYTGRVTTPVLWDKEEETIVNNESAEIIRMLDTAFDDYAENDVSLYPEGLREEVDAVVDDIYPSINNGVYRAGFAETQDAYDDAVSDLFSALTEYNATLGTQRYLAGDGERLTLADVCMFVTLYRFDEVYHTHFKCNYKQIRDYDHLWEYLKELCQLPGVADTCNMTHVKEHYYRSHGDINPHRLVPVGPDPDFFAPHTRDDLPGGPPEALFE